MPPSSAPGSVTRGPRVVPVGAGKRQFFKKATSPTAVCLFMPPFRDKSDRTHMEKRRETSIWASVHVQ